MDPDPSTPFLLGYEIVRIYALFIQVKIIVVLGVFNLISIFVIVVRNRCFVNFIFQSFASSDGAIVPLMKD